MFGYKELGLWEVDMEVELRGEGGGRRAADALKLPPFWCWTIFSASVNFLAQLLHS